MDKIFEDKNINDEEIVRIENIIFILNIYATSSLFFRFMLNFILISNYSIITKLVFTEPKTGFTHIIGKRLGVILMDVDFSKSR